MFALADDGCLAGRGVRAFEMVPPGCDGEIYPATPGEKSQRWLSPLGPDGAVHVDEKMGNSGRGLPGDERLDTGKNWHLYLGVLLAASAIYLGCIISPPSLMDDVDAVQAQIARNMLT